jgi:hypothetical protein
MKMKMNIDNLKLARQGFIDNYDRIAPHFNMKYFRFDELGEWCEFRSKTDCGTVGCALGWCPLLGITELEPIKEDYKKDCLADCLVMDFWDYSKRVMGLDIDTDEWDFLFSGTWADNSFKKPENTLDDFIARLDYFIENEGDI